VLEIRAKSNRVNDRISSNKMIRTAQVYVAAVAICMASGLTAGVALAQSLPDGTGKDVVEKVCAGCHDLDPITGSQGGTHDDWDMVVKAMIAMGADIKPEQAVLITNYLAQNFPPKQK
jgi:cytochrome c5